MQQPFVESGYLMRGHIPTLQDIYSENGLLRGPVEY